MLKMTNAINQPPRHSFVVTPLLQKEGKLLYTVSHSSPEFKLTAMGAGGAKRQGRRRIFRGKKRTLIF
jgi:hypothetical protein